MTQIKLCGLTRPCDIETANMLEPEYIGFVFSKRSRRYVDPENAVCLRSLAKDCIKTVGVFVNEVPEFPASLVRRGVIDMVQLHGAEDEQYISRLKKLADVPVIKAFNIKDVEDVKKAQRCGADFILFDSLSAGSGKSFDHSLIANVKRPYFLAGGLDSDNVAGAIKDLSPYAVDVSSGIETDGFKDAEKMKLFVYAVRGLI